MCLLNGRDLCMRCWIHVFKDLVVTANNNLILQHHHCTKRSTMAAVHTFIGFLNYFMKKVAIPVLNLLMMTSKG
ncbi:hypothetical protein GOP47_0011711 [Adiantum capillus-veneris]|uniref:Uncharacterized protein n=1 Tax=Adiantum capillus-veneris TaxID=13818 RepID=A0A9D4UUN8_ADICA|nr:hypothetical protein GOP47_0011711 [Adiantum capillus-veneris]